MAMSSIPAVAHAAPEPKPSPSASSPASSPVGEEKRYIVRYENNVNAESKSDALEAKGIEVKDTISHVMKASVVVADAQEIDAVKKSKDVASVELDQKVSINAATSLWGLDRVDQRSGRDGQYNIGSEGTGVNVYVIDSGINSSHNEFTGRLLPGFNALNDGTGTTDCNGHGTHVSGTIAGTVYGVAKKANVVPIKALQCDGSGWSSTVVAGIDWAISHHQAGQPAVLNLSIGGFSAASMDYAVQNAINDGITVVASSGNSGQDACLTSPAKVGPAITVAATDINDTQVSWANYGSCVDIQAPGINIQSAWNNSATGYNTLSGTSMAAPHVSGAAAVLLSRDRSLTPAQVHQKIIEDATVGVINGNKGSTPNRMLFIPALSGPSCSNLKLGDAWAGIGLTCKANGGAASDSTSVTDSGTGIEAAAPNTTEPTVFDDTVPALPMTPAPAPLPAEAAEIPVNEQPESPAASVPAADAPVSIDTPVVPTQVPAAETAFPVAVSFTDISPIIVTSPEEKPAKTAFSGEPMTITSGEKSAAVSQSSAISHSTENEVQVDSSYQIAISLSLVMAWVILLFGMIAVIRNHWNYHS